jgi:carbon-monoxide dehydrogenase iron sulfur subunit
MQKSLHIDPGKCTGCLQCEMACSYEHTGMFNPSKSRIKVFDFHHEGRKVPYTCTQCAEAWCLNACPVEAIKIDAWHRRQGGPRRSLRRLQGVHDCLSVRHDQLQPRLGKVQKCDLCGGDPACATACPTGAITYIDADWTGLQRMRQWAQKTDSAARL